MFELTDDIVDGILNGKRIRRISRLVNSSENFRDTVYECSDYKLEDLTAGVRSLVSDWKRLSSGILREHTLIQAALNISKNMGLTEAMHSIVDEICTVLNCDRASVFILDELNG